MVEDNHKAGWYYHHPEYRYNCAQAIGHCWIGTDDFIAEMKNAGSGRASNGQCGALYAAKIVSEGLKLNTGLLEKSFGEKAGSLICREIRSQRIISCRQCVDLAHDILKDLVAEKERG